jgi:branched-chain amino acid transport system permease protein
MSLERDQEKGSDAVFLEIARPDKKAKADHAARGVAIGHDPAPEQRMDIGMAAKAPELPRAAPRFPASLALALLLAAALALPFAVKGFVTFQLTMVMIYAIAIMGLNLLTGFNGQFSLGHGAFFAVGAYTAAILMDQYGLAFGWTLPAAALAAFAFGVLLGLPALRLENIYLALVTFSLAAVTPLLLKLRPFEHWTGGVQGIVLMKPDAPFGLPLSQDQWLYFVTLGVGLLLYAVAVNIVRSRTGRAVMAIRENPIAARAMGIDVSFYKTLIFGVSALYTGVAGALSAVTIAFVAPDSFTVPLSVALLVGLVIGGVGWLPGAVVGGAFVLFVPNIAEEFSKGLSGAVYGVILLLVVYLMPSGASAVWRAVETQFSRRRKDNP